MLMMLMSGVVVEMLKLILYLSGGGWGAAPGGYGAVRDYLSHSLQLQDHVTNNIWSGLS